MKDIYLHFFENPTCYCGNATEWALGAKRFREFCSRACMNASPEVVKRRRKTCKERFGTENPNELPEIKERVKSTFQKNYGVDNPSKLDLIKGKKRATMRANFGADHWSHVLPTVFSTNNPMHNPRSVSKQRATNKARYGHDNVAKSERVQRKMKDTFKRNYGVDNPRKAESVKKKVTAAYLEWIANPTNKERFVKAIMGPQRKDFAHYEVRDPMGVRHRVQGYERFVVPKLNPRKVRSVSTEVPCIRYGNDRFYFPDLVLHMKDGSKRLLEVKSMFTLCYGLENNILKFEAATKACRNHGNVSFWLIVSDKDGNLTAYSNPVKFAKRCRDQGLGIVPRRSRL